MQYREFGNTGIKLSALGFGAMRLPQDEDMAVRVIQRAFELGVNYLDTAYVYGESEKICGRALKGWRDKIYLSTKNLAATQANAINLFVDFIRKQGNRI